MPHSCAVIGCSNRSNRERDRKFFRVPSIISSQGERTEELSRKRRARWFANICRADLGTNNDWFRVCSDHFVNGKPSRLYPEESIDWAPTLKMGHDNIINILEVARERPEPMEPHGTSLEAVEALIALRTVTSATAMESDSVKTEVKGVKTEEQDYVLVQEMMEHYPEGTTKSCQTELTMEDIAHLEDTIEQLQTDSIHVNSQLYDLRLITLNHDFSKKSLRHNYEKVKFYTGLVDFCMLMTVFRDVAPFVNIAAGSVVDKFTEFMITLVHLHLNIPLQDLAYRFNVSCAAVSIIFRKWIEMMDVKLSHTIMWPDRETLEKARPLDFSMKLGKGVAVILDCFEVFVESPSSLCTKAMTWSDYEHHNTVKFLISITPQGKISFISSAWGGHVSNKFLMEKCGVLRNLLPGDVVLADGSFTMEDNVGFYCAHLKIPTFTNAKSQLLAVDVVLTSEIASSIQVHVEKILGLVRRKYLLLQGTLPVEFVTLLPGQNDTLLNKITRVCCSLTNLSNRNSVTTVTANIN